MHSNSRNYILILTIMLGTLVVASLLFISLQQDRTTGVELELEGTKLLNDAMPLLFSGQPPENSNINWIGVYNPNGLLDQQLYKAPLQVDIQPSGPITVYEDGYLLARPLNRHRMMMEGGMMDGKMNQPRPPRTFIFMSFSSQLYDYSAGRRILAVTPFVIISLGLLAVLFFLLNRIKHYQLKEQQNASLIELGMASKTLAHEIKNPLATIKAQSVLLKHMTQADDFSDSLDIINSETTRIAQLIDKMRLLTTPGNGTPEWLDIQNELDSIINSRLIDKVTLISKTAKMELYFDQTHFQSIMRNILQNAAEADANELHIKIHIHNKKVVLLVDDNGRGLGDVEKEKIFLPFYTNKTSGSGIGLALSKSYIDKVGGSIEIRDTRDFSKGTCICIQLPKTLFREYNTL